jgi:ABC-type glycerol-3-phosphate transport system permease component
VLTETQSITVPVALTQFIGQYLIVWGEIMAGIVLLTAPLIIFAIVLRRYMVSGISQGAVRE